MTPQQALDLINQIAATGVRAKKKAYLTQLMASELGKFVIEWTCNPFVTYGLKVTKLPDAAPGIGSMSPTHSVVGLLTDLSRRALTGNAAKLLVDQTLTALDQPSRELMFKILNKDLKCGVHESLIEEVCPGLLKIFKVARAKPFETKRIVPGKTYIGEPKLDGMRCTFIAEGDKGAFFTRSGKAIPALQYLAEPLIKAAHVVRLAAEKKPEILAFTELYNYIFKDGQPAFVLDTEVMNGLFADVGAVRRKDEEARDAELHAFDLLPADGFLGTDHFDLQWTKRRQMLEIFVSLAHREADVPVWPTSFEWLASIEEIDAFYERMISTPLATYLARDDAAREAELMKILIDKATGEPKCLEGAMIKNPASGYQKGQSFEWLKMKPEDTVDVFVTGIYPGEPNTKYEHVMGGLEVDYKGVTVKIGGGWSDDLRHQLWADHHQMVVVGKRLDPETGETSERTYEPGEPIVGRMIEVKFNEVTPDGSLRHPRFVAFRDDKAGEARRDAA